MMRSVSFLVTFVLYVLMYSILIGIPIIVTVGILHYIGVL